MTVAPLAAVDAAEYRELRLFGLGESQSAFCSSPADEADRPLDWFAAKLTPAADGSACVFGARVDGRLVGILGFTRQSRAKLRHWATLTGLYVHPDARRCGVGGTLVDAAVAHARTLPGLRLLRLAVTAGNRAACALYESRGFRCVGVEPEVVFADGRYHDEELRVLRLS
jgi:ribosomal protein S18 acetylase RimI-like enzyme